MELVQKANFRESVNPTPSIGSSNKNQFSDQLKLVKVEGLLRNTSQYEKWTQICQRNDKLAAEITDIILKRHEILDNLKLGQAVDWSLFDDLTQKLKKNGISLFESSEFSRQNSGLAKTSPKKNSVDIVNHEIPSNIRLDKAENVRTQIIEKTVNEAENKPVTISDENLLLLNVNYKKYILGSNLAGYGDSEKLFLPLEEITRTLDFMIETDSAGGSAKGWFVSEDRKFDLDMSKMEVSVDGKKMPIPANSVTIADEEIYVDSNLLSKWFPVDFHFNFSEQALAIAPREKLPFQERIEREKGLNMSFNTYNDETIFPREYSDYKLLGPQFVDLSIGTAYTHNAKNENNSSSSDYTLQSRGDLGKMSSEIYLAGNSENKLNDTNFIFKRIDPDANLLGYLKATSISAGDIYTTNIPGVGGDYKERGISLSNQKLFRSRDFDTTFFEGSQSPGWDVELYRNDVLMNTKRVGDEGKYYFGDIPIYYGKNNYKLVFYGPQGQKRVETKNIDVRNDALKKGAGEYNISLTQKNTDVYDSSETDSRDKESPKLNATFDYGVNEKISMGVGVSSQEIDSERYDFLNLNAKGNYKDVHMRGDYINDTEGNDAFMALAQTQIGDVNLKLNQKIYNKLQNQEYSQTDISASGTIKGKSLMPDIYTSLSFQNTKRENSRETMLSANIASNTKNLSLSNYLQWRDTSVSSDDSTGLEGIFKASSQMENFRLTGSLDYDIKPSAQIKSVQLSSSYNIADNLSSRIFIRKNMEEDGDYEGSLGLNWNRNNGKFIISPSISYNNKDDLTARVNFSTSFGVDPKTKKGRISSSPMGKNGAALINVYNDRNNNSVFDKDDEVIKGALIKAVRTGNNEETDENGVAVLTDLQNYRPIDILLDKSTIEDPYLEPKKEGISIIPRPGHIQEINIPVIGTGEIDGTIYQELKDGTEKPYANAMMQLIDKNGNVVQETRSEYDGFYLFTKVPHGNYSVRIDPEQLEKKGLDAIALSDMNIVPDDNILSGHDIRLAASTEEKIAAATKEVPEQAGVTEKIVAATKEVPEQAGVTEKIAAATKETPDIVSAFEKTGQKTGPDKVDGMKDSEKTVKEIIPLEQTASTTIKEPESLSSEKEKEVSFQKEKFGLHLTSYRTSEKAIAGIDYLRKKYKDILGNADFTVKKVHVSDEKGIWFRVFAGSFDNEEKAEKLKKQIKMSLPYCRVLSLGTDADNITKKGVHLTSFRTTKKAMLSIKELQEQYPVILKDVDFSIKNVDLGPEKGKWKRVIAGNFSNESDAKLLAKRIKMSSPYGKTMRIEENEEFGIHLASFKTCEKASRGLEILQKKFSSTLNNEDFSIRKVNLGDEKGIWYRIFSGRFKDKDSAISTMNSLNNMKQYARIVNFSNQNIQHL